MVVQSTIIRSSDYGNNLDLEFANALNGFYNRFDTTDFSKETQDLSHKLDDSQPFL